MLLQICNSSDHVRSSLKHSIRNSDPTLWQLWFVVRVRMCTANCLSQNNVSGQPNTNQNSKIDNDTTGASDWAARSTALSQTAMTGAARPEQSGLHCVLQLWWSSRKDAKQKLVQSIPHVWEVFNEFYSWHMIARCLSLMLVTHVETKRVSQHSQEMKTPIQGSAISCLTRNNLGPLSLQVLPAHLVVPLQKPATNTPTCISPHVGFLPHISLCRAACIAAALHWCEAALNRRTHLEALIKVLVKL